VDAEIAQAGSGEAKVLILPSDLEESLQEMLGNTDAA
jgi:flavoprotein